MHTTTSAIFCVGVEIIGDHGENKPCPLGVSEPRINMRRTFGRSKVKSSLNFERQPVTEKTHAWCEVADGPGGRRLPGMGGPGGGRDSSRRRLRPMSVSSGRSNRSGRRGQSPVRGPSPMRTVGMPCSTPCSTTCGRTTRRRTRPVRCRRWTGSTRSRPALATVAWPPAQTLREEVREWLRPRVRLAWARQAAERDRHVAAAARTIRPSRPTGRAGSTSPRTIWAQALRDYDAAQTVQQRQAALRPDPRGPQRARPAERGPAEPGPAWQPSWELEAAMNDLFNRPISTSPPTWPRSPRSSTPTSCSRGPSTRKGYTSMVTAGPKTGFGLCPATAASRSTTASR